MRTFYDAVVEEVNNDNGYKFVHINGYIYVFYDSFHGKMNDGTLVCKGNNALDVMIGIALFAELHDLDCKNMIQQGHQFSSYLFDK